MKSLSTYGKIIEMSDGQVIRGLDKICEFQECCTLKWKMEMNIKQNPLKQKTHNMRSQRYC